MLQDVPMLPTKARHFAWQIEEFDKCSFGVLLLAFGRVTWQSTQSQSSHDSHITVFDWHEGMNMTKGLWVVPIDASKLYYKGWVSRCIPLFDSRTWQDKHIKLTWTWATPSPTNTVLGFNASWTLIHHMRVFEDIEMIPGSLFDMGAFRNV